MEIKENMKCLVVRILTPGKDEINGMGQAVL